MNKEIQSYDYVICPYCNQKLSIIQHTHLKKHGKTIKEFKEEFPNYPIKCLRVKEAELKGAIKSAQTHSQPKKIQCIYCSKDMWVKKNESNNQACQECLDKGFENPDGRTKIDAYQKRSATWKKKYGVDNVAELPEILNKRNKTNFERHGGTGFASKRLAKKTKKVIKEKYGAENIMQTEEGYSKFIVGLQKRYGKDITNAQHVFEVRKRTSQTLIEKFKKEGHHNKGKSYIELYGENAANKLIELRRKSGAKGFKKSLKMGYGPSKPQLELFEIVKQVIPEAKLEFGQNLLYNDERYYYFLDIAITELKINIEYDCAWTHPDPEKDKFRDKVLSNFGWKTIRYFERIPSKEELE